MPGSNVAREVPTNADSPIPQANTGSWVKDTFADLMTRAIQVERRFDPLFRPAFEATLRDPLARLITRVMNAKRTKEYLANAQELPLPGEDAFNQAVIETFRR
jgi:hypothetical protein